MTQKLEDLWPDLTPTAIVTPASILKTQAAVLSQKSKGLLLGEVETWTDPLGIHHRLVLVVPALDNYRYELVGFHHSHNLYPVFIDSSPVPPRREIIRLREDFVADQILPDEDSFREWLRTVFGATETKRILDNLLAQASS
jgi:hypothetical protein